MLNGNDRFETDFVTKMLLVPGFCVVVAGMFRMKSDRTKMVNKGRKRSEDSRLLFNISPYVRPAILLLSCLTLRKSTRFGVRFYP